MSYVYLGQMVGAQATSMRTSGRQTIGGGSRYCDTHPEHPECRDNAAWRAREQQQQQQQQQQQSTPPPPAPEEKKGFAIPGWALLVGVGLIAWKVMR